MTDFVSNYYGSFGVGDFHAKGYFGSGKQGMTDRTIRPLKLYIIDTGFSLQESGPIGSPTYNPDLSQVIVEKFANDRGIPTPYPAHADLTCALVAAPANNWGILGVCPDATIYLGDVDDAENNIYDGPIAAAIDSAIAKDVDVISISLGSEDPSDIMRSAVKRALAKGILVFASSGNSGKTEFLYPSSFPGVISVASCNLSRKRSSFNTLNSNVALFAPGEDYYLPTTLGGVRANGTSFACPFAAGLACLYLGKQRYLRNDATYRASKTEIVPILKTYLEGNLYADPFENIGSGTGGNIVTTGTLPSPSNGNGGSANPTITQTSTGVSLQSSILFAICIAALVGAAVYAWSTTQNEESRSRDREGTRAAVESNESFEQKQYERTESAPIMQKQGVRASGPPALRRARKATP